MTGNSDTGGATLEQQLAKNFYLPQDDGIITKVQEAELAPKLDTTYPKDEVLRWYLADAYFGQGFHGLPAAADGGRVQPDARQSWAPPRSEEDARVTAGIAPGRSSERRR